MASLVSSIQAYLILLCSTLLHLTDVAFLTNWRQHPPPAKRLRVALLQYLLYCDGLEPNLQYLWGMPIPLPTFSPHYLKQTKQINKPLFWNNCRLTRSCRISTESYVYFTQLSSNGDIKTRKLTPVHHC